MGHKDLGVVRQVSIESLTWPGCPMSCPGRSRAVEPAPSALAFIDVYALIPPLQIEKGIAGRIESHAPHARNEYPMIAAVDDFVSFALE